MAPGCEVTDCRERSNFYILKVKKSRQGIHIFEFQLMLPLAYYDFFLSALSYLPVVFSSISISRQGHVGSTEKKRTRQATGFLLAPMFRQNALILL